MATYAKVDVRIWDDKKVRELSPIPPCGQGLWIRLLVSRHRSPVPGLLCVGEAALAEEFGWSLEAFREAFREASAKGMVKADWKARFVWIPNACFYNRPESPNVVKSWRIPWDEAPECSLKDDAYRALKAFVEGLGKAFQEAFAKSCEKPLSNQEQQQDQEQQQEGNSPGSSEPAKLRPNNPLNLETCMRAAIQREQPQVGQWVAGRFSYKDAEKLLRDLGNIEAALPELERKIELFAKDPDMQPWTMAKFVDKYNSIGLPKLEFGRAPKQSAETERTPIRW